MTADMPDTASLAARIEQLETRIAYQDQAIEELSQALTAQWAQVDALKRDIVTLTDRLQQAESRAAAAPEPPPPHY